jgi:hypothetical protein
MPRAFIAAAISLPNPTPHRSENRQRRASPAVAQIQADAAQPEIAGMTVAAPAVAERGF